MIYCLLGDNIKNKNRFRKPLLKGEDNYESYYMFLERFKIPFIFLWVVLLFEPVFVSYLESRDQDPFVTGKTERLGW